MYSRQERARCRARAEARDARRKEQRAARRMRDAGLARALRQPSTTHLPAGPSAADLPRRYHHRLRQLVAFLQVRHPRLLDRRFRALIHAVATHQWVRPLDDWRTRHRNENAAWRGLVRHLLCRYRVPAFLINAVILHAGRDPHREVALVAWLGAGNSLRRPDAPQLHTARPTRRLYHYFLNTPTRWLAYEAEFRAEVLSSGGTALLARDLLAADLNFTLEIDGEAGQAFRSTVLHWLGRQRSLSRDDLEDIVWEIIAQHKDDSNWRLTGRTPAAILRAAADREKFITRHEDIADQVYRASGLAAMTWTEPEWGRLQPIVWRITELLSGRALVAEGRALHHCIATYAEEVQCGECAIWSLRRDGRRRLTIEVTLATGTINAVEGRAARKPNDVERRYLQEWAARNGLEAEVLD